MVAHDFDDDPGDFRQEWLRETEHPAVSRRAPEDQAQDVAPAFVGRQHTVADQEGDRSSVVGDDPIGNDVGVAFDVGRAQQLLSAPNDRQEEIVIVVRLHVLEDTDDPLEAHAGVNVLARQERQASRPHHGCTG